MANVPAPNTPYFVPAQYPSAGTAFDPQPDDKPIPTLFRPLNIRGVEFHNRIWVGPTLLFSWSLLTRCTLLAHRPAIRLHSCFTRSRHRGYRCNPVARVDGPVLLREWGDLAVAFCSSYAQPPLFFASLNHLTVSPSRRYPHAWPGSVHGRGHRRSS